MKKGKIIFEIDYDRKLEEKILLEMCSTNFDNFTLLNLSKALGTRYKDGSENWEKLRFHLLDMVKRGLIEERHFDNDAGDWKGITDYTIESKGIAKVKQIQKRKSSPRV